MAMLACKMTQPHQAEGLTGQYTHISSMICGTYRREQPPVGEGHEEAAASQHEAGRQDPPLRELVAHLPEASPQLLPGRLFLLLNPTCMQKAQIQSDSTIISKLQSVSLCLENCQQMPVIDAL